MKMNIATRPCWFFLLAWLTATLLQADGGAQRSMQLKGARPTLNASNFASLQAAFDALPPEGGHVRIPAGTFEISEPLVISRSDVLIEGSGTASHIKNVNSDGKPALLVQHPDGNDVRAEDRLWRVKLSNFRITGNEDSGHGIEAIQIEEIFIQGVTVSENGGDGIHLDSCYEDPRICDSLITYNGGVGLTLLGCHDIVVSANQFEENQDALHCIDSFNLCMSGNNLDDHLGDGVVIENTYGSVVSGNMIEECRDRAIVLDRDCYGDTISANVIAHNGSGVVLIDAHGCAVSANTFTIMREEALRIGPKSSRIAVTGNSFSNSYIGDGEVKRGSGDRRAGGLVLAGTEAVAISGNVFSGLDEEALKLADGTSRKILFANNLLIGSDSDHEKIEDSLVDSVLEVDE